MTMPPDDDPRPDSHPDARPAADPAAHPDPSRTPMPRPAPPPPRDTDSLIAALAADPVPGPVVGATAARALALALPVAGLAMVAGLGLRDGLSSLAAITAIKSALPLAVAVTALGGALALARPERGRSGARGPLLVLALAGVAMVAVALARLPVPAWGPAFLGSTLGPCLVSVPALAALPTAALIAALRRGATTRPGLAGFLAGLAGGGLGAALYALHCTEDAAPFFVTWYGTGILVTGLAGAAAGRRWLRW